MSSAATRTYAWLIEQYLNGRLPLPGPVLQALLKGVIECYYRFVPTLKEMPEEWGGSTGPIAMQSEDLMRIHYDMPGMLFENFLGPTMKYTMALYERGARNLEEAQEHMMDDLCEKAGIRDGDHILDIACGFGSLSAHMLKRFPASKVVAVNLSQTQVDYINARQSEPGHPLHTDRFRIIKEDFAKIDFGREFDRIMVIGLFEHIKNIDKALEKIAGFLKPDGTVLLHFIAYNRLIRPMADPTSDIFFGKYIFPGGRFWHFPELPKHDRHLRVEKSWYMNGKNYMRTLQAWRENFWKNIDAIRAHPELDERFIRIWDLYLRFCIAIFGGRGGENVGNGQYLLRHAQPVQ